MAGGILLAFGTCQLQNSLYVLLQSFTAVQMFQVSTPVELPAMTVAPKQDIVKMAVFTPPPSKGLSSSSQGGSSATKSALGTDPQVSLHAAEPAVDDADEELDQLLSLQKPVSDVSGSQSVSVTDEESAVTDKCEYIQQPQPHILKRNVLCQSAVCKESEFY